MCRCQQRVWAVAQPSRVRALFVTATAVRQASQASLHRLANIQHKIEAVSADNRYVAFEAQLAAARRCRVQVSIMSVLTQGGEVERRKSCLERREMKARRAGEDWSSAAAQLFSACKLHRASTCFADTQEDWCRARLTVVASVLLSRESVNVRSGSAARSGTWSQHLPPVLARVTFLPHWYGHLGRTDRKPEQTECRFLQTPSQRKRTRKVHALPPCCMSRHDYLQ